MITEDPTPDKVAEKLSGGVEDTLLLINMMKDLRMRELKKAKVWILSSYILLFGQLQEQKIYEMAMEMKRKKELGLKQRPKNCWI